MQRILKIQLLVLVAATFLAYIPSFWNPFIWDDEQFIYKNVYVLNFDLKNLLTQQIIAGANHPSDYYRPITALTFAVDHTIYGLRPFGFHLSNTIFHTLAGCLLLLLLTQLGLNKSNKKFGPLNWLSPALIISLWFLLNPLQVEAVAYINSRGDSLYALFTFLTINLILLANNKFQTNQAKYWFLIAASFMTAAISFLSKEIGIITMPLAVICLWLTYQQQKNPHQSSKYLISLANLAIVSGLYVLARVTIFNFGGTLNLYREENAYTQSLLIRFITFLSITPTYWRLLILPFPLHMERTAAIVTTFFNPNVLLGLTILLLLTLVMVGLKIKNQLSPLIIFGLTWMMIAIGPVSGIVPINGLIYEHWLYLPLVGFMIFIYGLLREVIRMLPSQPHVLVYKILILSITVLYLALTWRQIWLWQTPIRWYGYLIKFSPSARVYNNLAIAYNEQGQNQAAIDAYLNAIKLDDSYPQTRYNLGNTYADIGNIKAAKEQYLQAIAINPSFYYSFEKLVNIYAAEEDYENVVKALEELRQQNPYILDYWFAQIRALHILNRNEDIKKLESELLQMAGKDAPKLKIELDKLHQELNAATSAKK